MEENSIHKNEKRSLSIIPENLGFSRKKNQLTMVGIDAKIKLLTRNNFRNWLKLLV